uniref:Uncharacterized protein n=1 Tax=Opuntia streptacantha TaxID=393608 RepID=A0A7C8ZGS7_OPUST
MKLSKSELEAQLLFPTWLYPRCLWSKLIFFLNIYLWLNYEKVADKLVVMLDSVLCYVHPKYDFIMIFLSFSHYHLITMALDPSLFPPNEFPVVARVSQH